MHTHTHTPILTCPNTYTVWQTAIAVENEYKERIRWHGMEWNTPSTIPSTERTSKRMVYAAISASTDHSLQLAGVLYAVHIFCRSLCRRFGDESFLVKRA